MRPLRCVCVPREATTLLRKIKVPLAEEVSMPSLPKQPAAQELEHGHGRCRQESPGAEEVVQAGSSISSTGALTPLDTAT